MSKRKQSESKGRRGPAQGARVEAAAKNVDASWMSPAAIRETVESIIVAFVLAFLFRTFEAEAFVIPTGSMAPTLMGKHKDLDCPMCNYRYQVSASDHPNSDLASRVYRSTCPMCRFTADLAPDNPQKQSYPSYDGDRILVAKFPYEFAEPKRWDVIVFKYPDDATMNYIKRLVGLPGETLKIEHGDVWLRQPDGHFEIVRKPPEKILAMLQPVYDNDLAPTITGSMHWPARWTPEAGGGNAWTNGKTNGKSDLSSFEIEGAGKGEIRYRHRVPTSGLWQDVATAAGKPVSWELTRGESIRALNAKEPTAANVPPQLISDFTAYNTGFNDQSDMSSESLIEQGFGRQWVGDLAVKFDLESRSASGTVVVKLIKCGRPFECRFDLASGNTDLAIGGGGAEAEGYHRTAMTPVRGAGRHAISFANVDDELTLWVDGKVVAFKDPARPDVPPPGGGKAASEAEKHPNGYKSALLGDHIPTEEDLSPVRIAADGASVKVSHLKIFRDIYYIAVFNEGRPLRSISLTDFISQPDLSDPRDWSRDFGPGNMKSATIKIEAPDRATRKKTTSSCWATTAQSSDGRLWAGEWSVQRDLLIGKALFIYWPHGWEIPYLHLPFNPIPYFQRMRLVR